MLNIACVQTNCFSATFLLYFERKIKRQTTLISIQPSVDPSLNSAACIVLSSSLWTHVLKVSSGVGESEDRQVPSGLPVTRSSAVLVACPDPLVALREYRPLLAFVTAGIVNLARPSLKEICTPGRVEVEITWPSRNQLTSGTGKPGAQRQFSVMFDEQCQVLCSFCYVHCLVLSRKSCPECSAM